jgi:hypothetical protein
MNDPELADLFAHLKQRASERADRTVERIRAGVAALQATGSKDDGRIEQAGYARSGARLLWPQLPGDPSKRACIRALSGGCRRIQC